MARGPKHRVDRGAQFVIAGGFCDEVGDDRCDLRHRWHLAIEFRNWIEVAAGHA